MDTPAINLVTLPPWIIASRHFNDNPQPLTIQGVRESNRFLFRTLDQTDDPHERSRIFTDYVSVRFSLHHQEGMTETARKALRNSYLRFFRGWMMDSNSIEGAVLKGWVESRFGLVTIFHNGRLDSRDEEIRYRYVLDRTKGSRRTNAINSQLDLMYEFCQYELCRRLGDRRHITLYRGVYDTGEFDRLETIDRTRSVVRLNNLNSFTLDEERAWEFGSTVWRVRVPLVKIVFFDRLLPTSIMTGEGEYLALGGEYLVERVRCTP